MSEQIKFCKDCRWCKPDRRMWWLCLFLPFAPLFAWMAYREQWDSATCLRAPELDGGCRFVRPQPPEFRYASSERAYDHSDRCGPSARHFEVRP